MIDCEGKIRAIAIKANKDGDIKVLIALELGVGDVPMEKVKHIVGRYAHVKVDLLQKELRFMQNSPSQPEGAAAEAAGQ